MLRLEVVVSGYIRISSTHVFILQGALALTLVVTLQLWVKDSGQQGAVANGKQGEKGDDGA